jgi:hypothetical protein
MRRYQTYQEGAHFISCLLQADSHLRQGLKDEANVRWIILALHDALYALLIEKLARTDGFGIFNDRFEEEVKEFYRNGLDSRNEEFMKLSERSISENLAGIGKLLERANLPSGIQIRTRNYEDLHRPSRGLSRLKDMRDFLSHPRPMVAAYTEDYITEACLDAISAIREVHAVPGQRALRHDPEEAEILLNSIEYYLARWDMAVNKDE